MTHGMIKRLDIFCKRQPIFVRAVFRSVSMSAPNQNPFNGQLPPGWDDGQSSMHRRVNPYANAVPPRMRHSHKNVFSCNPHTNQQDVYDCYRNAMQNINASAQHLNNPLQMYPQNNSNIHAVNPYFPTLCNAELSLPFFPSLTERYTQLEDDIARNYGAELTRPNRIGNTLHDFVHHLFFVPPPPPPSRPPPPLLTQTETPITTLYTKPYHNLPFSNNAQFGMMPREKYFTRAIRRKWSPGLKRFWNKLRHSSKSSRNVHFSVLNFNVLAQDLLEMHPDLYCNHDETALEWPVRWNNLQNEFDALNCDIICLQEVQESHKVLFDERFKNLGFQGIYKKRTGAKSDGCSIYYRQDMFQLLEFISVEFNQPRIHILDRDNIAIIAKFLAKANQQEFVVANTHLLFNPRRQDIRLGQTQLLLTEIDRLAHKQNTDSDTCEYHPTIVVGDFNSTPDSSVIELIKSGQLEYEHLNKRTLAKENITSPNGKILIPSFLKITDSCQHKDTNTLRDESLSRQEQLKRLSLYHSEHKQDQPFLPDASDTNKQFSTGTLKHKFQFQSVYDHGTDDNPEGTTHQGRWITTDYIFYNRSSGVKGKDWKLNLLARYSLPTCEDLRYVTIPNHQLGSDHLSLVAKFALKAPRKQSPSKL